MREGSALSGRMLLRAPNASIDTINPEHFLGLGYSYIHAFGLMVQKRVMDLTVAGLQPPPATTAPSFGFGVSDENRAREIAEEIAHEVGRSDAKAMRDLTSRIEVMQRTTSVVVSLEKINWSTGLIATPSKRPETFVEVTERRVYVEKTGGRPATVRVTDSHTGKSVLLHATEAVAKLAGAMLYADADIHVRLSLRADDLIPVGGELLGIAAISDEPLTFEAMKKWWTGRYAGRA